MIVGEEYIQLMIIILHTGLMLIVLKETCNVFFTWGSRWVFIFINL